MSETLLALRSRLSGSPYLTQLVQKNVDCIELDKGVLFDKLEHICNSLEDYDLNDNALDIESVLASAEGRLLSAKSEFALVWSMSELLNVGSQSQRGRWQTRFAEVTIDFALSIAWRRVLSKHKALATLLKGNPSNILGLFIFGMGKLGGYDLNFSSDVDLVAYFDPVVLPVPDTLGKSYICHQVLQGLTKLLGQGGKSNFVWRVDWRLRPNASATTLAMSSVAAEDYYFYHASPWHRLALMKARVVAGDKSLGRSFLETLSPFIWRQNLDYRALDELAEIKQRINLEHPALRAQRQWREPISDEIAGFNVKLGSGGIREVEFISNALQLVWGGRTVSLRASHTITALQELVATEHMERDVCERLIECYETLRTIENAIQMHGNQQTHLVPNSESSQQELLVLLGFSQWSVLLEKVNHARRFVNQQFEIIFAEQEAAHVGPLVWPSGLSQQADEIVEAWENGYQIYGVSIQVRHRLQPLTRALADYLNESSEAQNETVMRLHEFFRSLPSGEQYFRLLAESPKLLRRFVPPLLYSPPMTSLLKQSPHIIDCYLHGEWQYPEPFNSVYVENAQNYEQQLEHLRRFVNEHLYQLYLEFLQGRMLVEAFQAALTDLAEHTLELALSLVTEQMGLDQPPITVIGLGKVALSRMSPLSDLDLIFVYDPDVASMEVASKFVNRLQTAISTPMREGYVYELDTRLRPSGRSGAPTVSIESFANHHRSRAHTWEHIALMPSRVVAGRKQAQESISAIKRTIISSPRDKHQFLMDSLKMWRRITEHRVSEVSLDVMSSKLRPGGLMQSEYLAACLILFHGPQLDVSNPQFDELLSQSVKLSNMEKLPEIIQFWRIQQLWERLLGKADQPLSSLQQNYLGRLLAQSGVSSLDELLKKKHRYAMYIEDSMTRFFVSLNQADSELDEWMESGVVWA